MSHFSVSLQGMKDFLASIDGLNDQQRMCSDQTVYSEADLGLCWSRIPPCWKSH